ncbi:MAG: ABC transporter substrate-binding protein [Micromonosporaceae bacterium]|nr:ABC transporter substrate-binding protein [Micromonosporaceae bacterium]
MRRSIALPAAALAVLLAAVTGCSGSDDKSDSGGSGSAEPVKVTYVTGFGTGGHDAFAYVGLDKGFFRDAGLDVQVETGQPATNRQTVEAGKAQFTYVDLTGHMIATSNGQFRDIRAIAAVHQNTLVTIFAPEGSGINAPKDLEGKKVGAAKASVSLTLMPAYAKLAGFDMSKVTMVEGDPQGLAGLLKAKKVDALSTFIITRGTVERVTGQKMIAMPFSDRLTDLLGTAIVTTDKFAKEHPKETAAFRDAALKSLQYTIDHPQEAAEIMKKHLPTINVESTVTEITLMKPYVTSAPGGKIGVIDEQRTARAIAILEGAGMIKPGLKPSDFVDFDIAPKV